MAQFKKRLDSLIQEEFGIASPEKDTSQQANDLIAIATQLQETVGRLQRDLEDTQIQITNIVEQLNTNLGWEIRKRQPKLMTTHRNGKCVTGYRTKDLVMQPDLAKKLWSVGGPLGGSFLRQTPTAALNLNSDVGSMADAVVNFFKQHYKSI